MDICAILKGAVRDARSGFLGARAVEDDAVEAGGGGNEKLMFGTPAKADVGDGFGHKDAAEKGAVGGEAMDAVACG